MNALVIYDSKFGNTERLARDIGTTLEGEFTVQVRSSEEPFDTSTRVDLLVVGGPTHAHGLSQPMRTFLASIPEESLRTVDALAFDTRFRMPAIISGRAATKIARVLQRNGAHLLVSPESFFVERSDGNPLETGEEQRATEWARQSVAVMAQPA